MGKVEDAVRETITRLVRKELRAVVLPLAREVRGLKRAVRGMAETVGALEKEAARRERERAKGPPVTASEEEVGRSRFSPGLIQKLRARLGVTQAQLGALSGVTGSAAAQWEMGRTAPRGKARAALVALRRLGRREVRRLLEQKGLERARRAKGRRRAKKKSR